MNNERISYILRQLFSSYPNGNVTEATVAQYIRLLSDIPLADLQTVVDQAVAECKFLPTVAELRERWHMLTRGLGEQSSAEAWGTVMEQVQKVGHIGAPRFDCEMTAAVVKAMGWREICMSEKPGIERAQFMRMYESHQGRAQQAQRLLPASRRMATERMGLQSIAGLLGITDDGN